MKSGIDPATPASQTNELYTVREPLLRPIVNLYVVCVLASYVGQEATLRGSLAGPCVGLPAFHSCTTNMLRILVASI